MCSEDDGQVRIRVTKREQTTENLTILIMALSFDEFNRTVKHLPDEFDGIVLPDPAECEICF